MLQNLHMCRIAEIALFKYLLVHTHRHTNIDTRAQFIYINIGIYVTRSEMFSFFFLFELFVCVLISLRNISFFLSFPSFSMFSFPYFSLSCQLNKTCHFWQTSLQPISARKLVKYFIIFAHLNSPANFFFFHCLCFFQSTTCHLFQCVLSPVITFQFNMKF